LKPKDQYLLQLLIDRRRRLESIKIKGVEDKEDWDKSINYELLEINRTIKALRKQEDAKVL